MDRLSNMNGVKHPFRRWAIVSFVCCISGCTTLETYRSGKQEENVLEPARYSHSKAMHYLNEKQGHRKAFSHFLVSAEAGNSESYRPLASLYFSGTGTERDIEQAAYWYEAAAISGDIDSMYQLAKLIDAQGTDTISEKTRDISMEWFQRAASHGHAASQLRIAAEYIARDQIALIPTIMRLLQSAANQNHVPAQVALGNYYQTGPKKIRDIRLARKWLQSAAASDNAEAQFKLAMLLNELDNPADERRAYLWFSQSAASGYAPAQYQLAIVLLGPSIAVDKDIDQALKWMLQSAETGYTPAECQLGRIYYQGIFVQQDFGKSSLWFSRAASDDDHNLNTLSPEIGLIRSNCQKLS